MHNIFQNHLNGKIELLFNSFLIKSICFLIFIFVFVFGRYSSFFKILFSAFIYSFSFVNKYIVSSCGLLKIGIFLIYVRLSNFLSLLKTLIHLEIVAVLIPYSLDIKDIDLLYS